ncbi:hypothetical protein BJY16_004639 [Actinoplanes octamycinicus]|uniref:Uncharacterized protein n=1 Tax=Actinoplanes octamycinicus TaxID=135948 RepID=A0A7W7M8U3_9ACTN|nr:hypothetical protein [Actinoplanes octamycinicus]MBB4741180.1 hypothetical protein [Actinoplanes octamycinicus]GIE56086.1 hypothetical protein Aoc01nite_14880 [Actinoplanes octamycinicus]
MAEIAGVRRDGWLQRMDALTGGAMVLTVEAVVFLMTALIGTPLLMFFAADDDASVGWLWPFGAVCVISAVLGSASAAAAFLIGSRGNHRDRQVGVVAASGIAVTTGLLTAAAADSSPLLAFLSALVAVANVGAATLIHRAEPAAEAETPSALPSPLPEAFLMAAPLAEAEIRTRETIEIDVRRPATPAADAPTKDALTADAPAADLLTADAAPVTIRPRRPRGPAALHTLSGVRLPRRAHRGRAAR